MTQPSTGAINASLRPEVDIGLLTAATAATPAIERSEALQLPWEIGN